MRAPPALLFLAACTRGVAAWAPLDVVAGLFGMKPLNSGQATRPYPIDDVEHVACSMGLGGCVPTKGCRVHMGRCEPRVGHYWPIPNAPPPPQLWFDRLLPAIAPAFHMMTERGVLEATPGFWFAGYRLLVRASPRRHPCTPPVHATRARHPARQLCTARRAPSASRSCHATPPRSCPCVRARAHRTTPTATPRARWRASRGPSWSRTGLRSRACSFFSPTSACAARERSAPVAMR